MRGCSAGGTAEKRKDPPPNVWKLLMIYGCPTYESRANPKSRISDNSYIYNDSANNVGLPEGLRIPGGRGHIPLGQSTSSNSPPTASKMDTGTCAFLQTIEIPGQGLSTCRVLTPSAEFIDASWERWSTYGWKHARDTHYGILSWILAHSAVTRVQQDHNLESIKSTCQRN